MTMASELQLLRAELETVREENRQLKEILTPDENSHSWRLGLSKTQIAMFERLERTEIASREALLSVIEATNGSVSSDKSLHAIIHYMRKRLKGSGYLIKTVWGVGYRLVKPEADI